MAAEKANKSGEKPPILSEYLRDESMAEIIQAFLDELPKRITTLQESHASANREVFCKIVHQLKGAGGGYGFSIISSKALALEKKIRSAEDRWQEIAKEELAEFISILIRAHAGRSNSGHT